MTAGTLRIHVSVLLLSYALAASVSAQTAASIEGIVTDATGAVLSGAAVEVAGETVRRAVTTSDEGYYRVVALPAGTYTVTSTATGFAPRVLRGVTIVLDRLVTLDIAMDVAGRSEDVNVSAGAMALDFSNSATRHVINAQTIQAIPLNGRNYLDLVLLTPGVVVNDNARSDLTNKDSRGSILGERAGNASFLIDGLDNNDDFQGGVFQSYTQDAVREFEVINSGYKAEFGNGSGGVINVITKSGTNDLHGSGFFFLRNDALDASNIDDTEAPELERYNGGGIVGGPVTRDRAWFFGSVERLRETREASFAPNIPEVLKEGEDFSAVPELTVDRLFGKYNRHLTPKHDLTTGWSWSRTENQNRPAGPTSLPSASDNNVANTLLGTGTVNTILGNRVLFDTSFGFRNQGFDQNQEIEDGRSFSIVFLDDGSSFNFGPRAASVVTVDQRYFTAREAVSFFLNDRHALRTGLEYTNTNVDSENGQGLVHVMVTTRASFAIFGRDSFQIPQGSAFLEPGDELTRLRNHGMSLFGQDDWRVTNNVTVNLGLRYDYDSEFDDSNNLAPRLGVVWRADDRTAVRANWGIFYDRYRLGIAGAIPELGGFDSRPVAELDYPRLFADMSPVVNIPGSFAGLRAFGDPFILHRRFNVPFNAVVSRDTIQGLTGLAPDAFVSQMNAFLATLGRFLPVEFSPATGYLRQDLGAALQDEITVARPFETPYNHTFSVGVERMLPYDLVAGATYLHREIRNILGLKLTNLDFRSRIIGGAVTTDGQPIRRTYGGWYDGDYDALVLQLNKRLSDRFQVQANYTYARAEDNLLNSNLALGLLTQGGGAVPTDNLDLEFDRGNSDLVVPHTFVASGVAQLPLEIGVSGVFRATSGVFFSAVGGLIDYDGDGISSTRPRGTTRNEFDGPGSANLDLRVEKEFTFGGRYTASALIEFFNVTNAKNPRLIDAFWVNGVPGPAFGDVRVPLPGREAQIGFRFEF